ncbi:MAG: L-lactate dehydrogenase [Elusimicrobia bacterium]|nr:L-lactate dehydrogenase [Candidatus Liberimonas magnetica]
MPNLKPKVSIIGCGAVGTRYAYALMIKGLARQIVMVDPNKKRLAGDVLDLSHGAPYVSNVDIINGEYSDIANSELVVITAGKSTLPGQSRLDVAKVNSELFKKIIPDIVKYAPGAVLLVVSNPVDVLSYVAYKISGKNEKEIIGSGTVLDSARLRYLLGKECRIDPKSIHAYILGEHGDSEFPVWSRAMIGGTLFKNYCLACKEARTCNHEEKLENIFNQVKNSAYNIIEDKGETSYGVGLSLVRISQGILRDENSIHPVSYLVKGYLGVKDVYMSLPAIVNSGGVREVLELDLDEKEQLAFKNSSQAIRKVLNEIGF